MAEPKGELSPVQTLPYSLIKEYILNHIRAPTISSGIFLNLKDIGVSGRCRQSESARTVQQPMTTLWGMPLHETELNYNSQYELLLVKYVLHVF